MTRLTLAMTLAMTFGSLSAACQSTANHAVKEPPIDLAALPADLSTVQFPLDSYEVTDEQQRMTSRAFDILTRNCLRRFGYEIKLGPPSGKPQPPTNPRFGLTDETLAEQYGYVGAPRKDTGSPFVAFIPEDVRAQVFELLTGQGAASVGGVAVPQGGCQQEAATKLHGTVDPNLESVVEDLKRQARDRSANDSRVADLMRQWQGCVKKAGFSFKSPVDAEVYWSSVRAKNASMTPSVEEKTAAVTDVKCKKDTGLLRTWVAVMLGYERQLIEGNDQRLRQSKQMTETAVRNAATIAASE